MRKSSGDPICGGFLNDASAVGPVKGIRESSGSVPDCLRLWELLRLPSTKTCKIPEPEGPCRKKLETTLSPRGDSRSAAAHRTNYEGAEGPKEIQRQLGITPDTNRLDKTGGLGSPQRPFGYFSGEGKVPRRRQLRRGAEHPKRKKKRPPARGPSGEVRDAPHRLRGGRRPGGDSAAARCQL